MQLTKEQIEVIKCAASMGEGEILKINAFAGSGKTFILRQIARVLKESSFLYLAFNKGIAEEAKETFPFNVACKTTHSLAWSYTKPNKVRSDYKALEIGPLLKVEDFLATHAKDAVEKFMNSSDSISGFKKMYKSKAPREFLYKLAKGEIDPTHSWYLKKFQLSNHMIHDYDYIFLDEAQDTNPVTMSIFLNKFPKSKLIIVGDSHQQIYSFRGSMDAMTRSADYSLYLTNTFRCSDSICKYANKIIKGLKGETETLHSWRDEDEQKTSSLKTKSIISRTNSNLINYISINDSFNLTRDPKIVFSLSLSVHSLLTGNPSGITPENAYLRQFKDEASLLQYVSTSKDVELKSSIKIAKKFKDQLKILRNKAYINYKSKEKSDLTLTSAHCAKGLEFDEVLLSNDFKNISQLSNSLKEGTLLKDDYEQEINLLYVAITRARNLITSEDQELLKEVLDLGKGESEGP